MSVRLAVEGIILAPYWAGVSRRPHTLAYRAHRESCRYAPRPDPAQGVEPLAAYVEALGEARLLADVRSGRVEPCKVCKPVLLVGSGGSLDDGR